MTHLNAARIFTPVWPQPKPACRESGGPGCGACGLRELRPTPSAELIRRIGLRRLTTRQCEVLVRVLAGDEAQAIAAALDLSLSTVRREIAASAQALSQCPVVSGERRSPSLAERPDNLVYLNE